MRARLTIIVALLIALAGFAFVIAPPLRAAEEDKGVLANLISKALSSPSTTVSIGAVDGALSSDATIKDIVLSDRDGPWLKLDKARLVWSRLALLKRRLEVDQLEIGHLQFLRKPLPAPAGATAPAQSAAGGSQTDAPILPELPLKVIIKDFGVSELVLGAPIVGQEAHLTIKGKATLGPPSEGLDLSLDAHRLDAGGAFVAKLGFVPQSTTLNVDVNFDEPAGGLISRLALPGAPPLKLTLTGAGPLDKFNAKLAFEAGPDIGANGGVDLTREGDARRLSLKLASRVEGLAPSVIKPVFAGETTLDGDMLINDDSSLSLSGLHLVSANARLDIEGTVGADRTLDVKIHAGAIPGAPKIGKLDFNAAIQGAASAPKINAKFDAEKLDFDQGALERAIASFSAEPNGALDAPATRIALAGDATASGLKLSDKALDHAVGSDVKLTFRAKASPEGALDVETLQANAVALNLSYAGLLSSEKAKGAVMIEAPDLSHFAALAGKALKGAATIKADIDGSPKTQALAATFDGHVNNLATGVAAADGWTGGQLTLSGVAESLAGGGFGFRKLALSGAHGQAMLDGAIGADRANLKGEIDTPDARALDPRIQGKATIVGAITGEGGRLNADVTASLDDGRLMDRPTSGLALKLTAQDLTGVLDAHAALSGDIGRQPLQGALHVAKQAEGGWKADGLSFSFGSAQLDGDVALGADSLASGKVTLNVGNFDDLSPLLLTRLAGALRAEIDLAAADGRQNAHIAAKSDKLTFGANSLAGLDTDLAAADVFGRKILSGAAKLAKANVGGETIADVNLKASAGADGSDLALAAKARGLALQARGRLTADAVSRFDLMSFSAVGNGQKLALSQPASFAFGGDGVDIKNFALGINAGRVSIDGHAGSSLDLRLKLAAAPLAVADLAKPGLGLQGVADGEATISGGADAPSGDWRIQLKGVSAPQMRSAGLSPVDIAGSGRLGGGRTTLDVALKAGAASALRATGAAPLKSDGALDIAVAGKLDAGLANSMLSASGQRLAGAVAVDAHLRGPIAKPLAKGSVTMTGGVFSDETLGLKLTGIDALIAAEGDQVRIERLKASTSNGGTLNVSGQARLDAEAGFPGSIHIASQRAQLVNIDVVAASVDLGLDVTGALARDPKVSGRVAVDSMDISVPERLGGVSAPLQGVKHLNPSETAKARLALDEKAKRGRAASPFNAALAIVVSAPNRVFVRGRGIDAELGGELKVNGTTNKPQIDGGFEMRRGSLSMLGKRLDFTSGKIQFLGDVIPELDMVAETQAGDITARITVTGPANKPTFAFSSDPSLPQDEILSRVLFQKTSGSLSPVQALQLANAAAELAGGGDSFERLRKTLGVDSLDVSTDSTGGAAVGVTRAINDRISVGVKSGAKPQDNGVNLDLDVTRHIRLQGGVDAGGGSSAGVGAQWEY
jgi:translocation and assembly module TamB